MRNMLQYLNIISIMTRLLTMFINGFFCKLYVNMLLNLVYRDKKKIT